MNHPTSSFAVDSYQEELERYLLESATVDREQLALAKKVQASQEGPLLAILLQLSFIDLQQFGGLLDWSVRAQLDGCII